MIDDFCRYFICFMVFSFIGWLYESLFYSVQLKRWVNSGFLHGFICPIYGAGGMLLMIFFGGLQDLRMIFLAGALVCAILEYFISWLLEYVFDARWWDYSDWPLNINGRVCAVSILGFGFASLIGTQFIIPFVFGGVAAMSTVQLHFITALMVIGLMIDLGYTLKTMDREEKEPWFIEEHSEMMEKRTSELNAKLDEIKRMIRRD